MINVAKLTKAEFSLVIAHKTECLERHYSNMTKDKALSIKNNLENGKPNKMSKRFVDRINNAKGYDLL